MYVITNTIYCNHLLLMVSNNACYILIQAFLPFRLNERISVPNSKNNLYINLRKCISHNYFGMLY